MTADDVMEKAVEVLIARPMYLTSISGAAFWYAAHFIAAPWRFLS